jgi:hypothetical protein
VAHQVAIAFGQILPGIGRQIAEGRRQAVAAMVKRRAAKEPESVLQPFGQRHEAFATEDDVGVFEAGIGEPEVIKQVIERLACDRDLQFVHVGEVGKPQSAGLMNLAKDDFLLVAIDGPPGTDPPFHCPANAFAEVRMAAQHLLEDGDRTNARCRLQQRHDLGIEDVGEWIGTPTAARLLHL